MVYAPLILVSNCSNLVIEDCLGAPQVDGATVWQWDLRDAKNIEQPHGPTMNFLRLSNSKQSKLG